MFSSEERLKERQGKYGTPRFEYLQALVSEFQNTSDEEAKEQVAANLANFAYDPINFEHLRRLNVMDLFLDCLSEPNEKLVEFGIGGICNCSPDPKNAAAVVAHEGLPLIITCLSSPVESTVLSAIASLYFLISPGTRNAILSPAVITSMERFADAESSPNVRVRNLARAFLDRHMRSSHR